MQCALQQCMAPYTCSVLLHWCVPDRVCQAGREGAWERYIVSPRSCVEHKERLKKARH